MADVFRRLLGIVLLLGLSTTALAQSQGLKIERVELGFNHQYKVGSWVPLRLSLLGGKEGVAAVAQVEVPDSDGVYTMIPSLPFSVPAGKSAEVELLVRIGQLESPLNVTIVGLEPRKKLAEAKLSPRTLIEEGGIPAGNPATTRLLVDISPTPLDVNAAGADRSNDEWYTQNLVAHVSDLASLPRQSFAYESVDTVLLSTSNRSDWSAIRPDDPRIVALVDWVQHGGRLLLFCGENAVMLLAPEGPLADLSPGKYSQLVTIESLVPLEGYVGGSDPLPNRGRIKRAIPTFETLQGDVELELGSREEPLPAIVRRRQGLGEVVFVGLDVDTAPIRTWSSRGKLVEKLLAMSDENLADESGSYYYSGPADVSLALQDQLDHLLEATGIRTPPFLVIAGLVFLYILLIGPGDYFLVKHLLKRMEMTWVTFPLIIIGTCAAAYWYANYLKGDTLRINQLEIVDVDNTSGLSRGTMWTHLFSPSPDRYNLSPEVLGPDGMIDSTARKQVGWQGRPAEGMGGMASDASLMGGRSDYSWSPDREQLFGVPIEVWSTKTFVSRWESETDARLTSELVRTPNNLLVGTITNTTSTQLQDCRLIYGTWAWRLGTLEPNETATIEASGIGNTASAPKKLRNMFKLDHNIDLSAGSYYEQQTMLRKLDLRGLAEMMMFYDTLGGRQYTHQWHRYQHDIDLSHALDDQTAMLIGSCSDPRSELVRHVSNDETQSMRGDKDTYVVLYRYLLPVSPDQGGSPAASADSATDSDNE